MRTLAVEAYVDQAARWPASGYHILAQTDVDAVVVYQAYRPSIAQAAVADQAFGRGGFSLGRMSWIKPSFLWMMYRAGWATKPGQEHVLAIWLRRASFDAILAQAVPSAFDEVRYADRDEWQRAVESSDVRVQWDPDHAPSGAPVVRRAIQLGLRGSVLQRFARHDLVEVQDITERVHEMHAAFTAGGATALTCPREEVYPVTGRV